MPSTTAAVPGGPTIGSGIGAGAITQRVVTTSLRSQMWSECRWVSSTAASCSGSTPAAASRMQHAAAGVDQQQQAAGPHERRRAGPVRVGQRVAGAQQGDLDRAASSAGPVAWRGRRRAAGGRRRRSASGASTIG